MWPVDDPPKPRLHTNLQTSGGTASGYFDGPLNVLIALHATQAAAIAVVKTREEYEQMIETGAP